MSHPTLRRIAVWSGLLRLSHWAMTLLVVALLLTGLLTKVAPGLAAAARDYHYMAGHVLLAVFFLRIYLLFFGRKTDLLQALVPGRLELRGAWAMLKFYLTLGKSPLPKWFAHNPLWMPIYLVFFLALLLQMITGLSYTSGAVFLPETTQDLHAAGARVVLGFAVIHTLAAFWHDWKGASADVSAMINGHRIFPIEKPQPSFGVQRAIEQGTAYANRTPGNPRSESSDTVDPATPPPN
ncbi:MAG: cytochrome b/b6 domain-containing protein [Thiotrichales bacterium]